MCTGTFLAGGVFIGESAYYSGRVVYSFDGDLQTSCTNMVSRYVDSRLGPLLACLPRHLIADK